MSCHSPGCGVAHRHLLGQEEQQEDEINEQVDGFSMKQVLTSRKFSIARTTRWGTSWEADQLLSKMYDYQVQNNLHYLLVQINLREYIFDYNVFPSLVFYLCSFYIDLTRSTLR